MSAIRKSITFTEEQDKWIKFQIKKGDYTNDSEYIRDLVRKDRTQNFKIAELQQAIEEGLSSGVSTKTISGIMSEVETTMKTNGEL